MQIIHFALIGTLAAQMGRQKHFNGIPQNPIRLAMDIDAGFHANRLVLLRSFAQLQSCIFGKKNMLHRYRFGR